MKVFLLVMAIVYSLSAKAQEQNEAIKTVIAAFFSGMKNNDTIEIKSSLDSNCFLYSVIQKKDGSTLLLEEKTSDFLKQVVQLKGQLLDEQLLGYDIKTDGALAIAWTPYKFYFNGTFSHCGVNVFTLIKRNNEWKIMGITDTRRKLNCN